MVDKAWPMKLYVPVNEEKLYIGRFTDELKLETAKKPVFMYKDYEEDLKDDEEYVGEKTAEFYQRRRKRRYSAKSYLVLEDSTKRPNGVKFKGTPIESKTEGADHSAKYVILQVSKSDGCVNVIKVDEWLQFQKDNNTKISTLDEVDLAFDAQEKQKKSANEKYKRISKAMEHNSKLFDETVAPRISQWPRNEIAGESTSSSGLFGLASQKSFSKKRTVQEVAIEAKEKSGTGESGLADMDGEKEYEDMCGYEYEETKSDDEEDAMFEQADLEEQADRKLTVDVEVSDDSGDEDEEEEEEEDKDEQKEDLVNASKQLKYFFGQGQEATGSDEGAGEIEKMAIDSSLEKDRLEDAQSAPLKKPKLDPNEASLVNLDLTEEGVRRYVSLMGGKIKTKDLHHAFKKQIKDLGNVGKDRFKAIVGKIMTVFEEPVLGKMLILK